jgi:hypothetical protein
MASFANPLGAGAGAGDAFEKARAMGPPAKRARVLAALDDDDDEITDASAGDVIACPDAMEKEDFERLAALADKFKADPYFRLLPMPPVAYKALGVPQPKTASLMEAALNCLNKTSMHTYSSNVVEVRDLRETHTTADFPTFYEGPSHPHMRPEGGVRVIEHTAPEAASASSSVGGAGAGAGAGAGSAMMDE